MQKKTCSELLLTEQRAELTDQEMASHLQEAGMSHRQYFQVQAANGLLEKDARRKMYFEDFIQSKKKPAVKYPVFADEEAA